MLFLLIYCEPSRLENQELKDKLQKLEEKIEGTPTGEKAEVSVTSPGEDYGEVKELPAEVNQNKEQGVELSPEQVKR